MIYIIAFIVLLGILVLAHELGHFLAAKYLGVKAEVFSMGFGKALWKKKVGDTEYRISMVPLGGYVKFYGDDKDNSIEEMRPYFFNTQKLWKRAIIVFAGPMCNFILAFFVFCMVFILGEPNISTKLGYVEQASTAYKAGLVAGDIVEKVNGVGVRTWMEFDDEVSKSKGEVSLDVKRDEKIIELKVPVTYLIAKNRYGETEYRYQIQGISPFKRSALIGVSNISPASKAGLKTGDLIYKVAGKEVNSWDELQDALKGEQGKVEILVKRAERKGAKPDDVTVAANITKGGLGLYPAELFISGFVSNESPAAKAGMKEGDRIYSVNGSPVLSFQSLQQVVDLAGRNGTALNIVAERDGKLMEFKIVPSLHNLKDDEMGQKDKRFLLGVETNFYPGPADQTEIKIWNPLKLIWAGIEKTLFWIWITIVGILKLITGAVSFKAVGGPLMIGKVAGDSLMLGVVYFLRILAVISINLGVINLFPVPVLDGGHLVLFSIEAIRRKPLQEKHVEIAQQVGFYLLIGLIVLSFYNDILKFGSALLGIGG